MLSKRLVASASSDIDLVLSFSGLETAPVLVLAVSGGPDSMALLHLAARWRDGLSDGPTLHVATVDHGLRPEAASEALTVATVATRCGLAHSTLTWTGPKPRSRLQEKAREARYRLLGDQARAIGAPFVLTAHHADDQAETVLMRLGRGSGIAGLAAMRRMTKLNDDVALVRPLLEMTKQDLLTICAAHELEYVADPSNEDPGFHRVRLRRQAEAAAGLGLDAPALLRLARRMARAEEALEAEVARKLAELQPISAADSWRADLSAMQTAAPEILQRLVGRATVAVGCSKHLSLERLETLADGLRAALREGRSLRATLGGALLDLDSTGILTVTPEMPRRRGRSRRD